jgi:uncharacterized phiE125 gp8 family phage protein
MLTEKAVDKKGNRFWKIITEPTSYPVTITEIKEFARIDGNEEDSILEVFLSGVVNNVEAYLGRALITRTYKMVMDEWNDREIELPMPPLISVSSIKTIDEDNVETTYDSSNYFVITESIPGRVVIKKDSIMPTNTDRDKAGYSITWNAGYTDIPKQIKIAIMQWVTMIYENRSMVENEMNTINRVTELQIPNEVKKILQPFRVLRV